MVAALKWRPAPGLTYGDLKTAIKSSRGVRGEGIRPAVFHVCAYSCGGMYTSASCRIISKSPKSYDDIGRHLAPIVEMPHRALGHQRSL